jgi:hypothetical protein
MGAMKFTVRTVTCRGDSLKEYLVEASCPAAGGDSGLIAVFQSELAARSLAHVLNRASAAAGGLPAQEGAAVPFV